MSPTDRSALSQKEGGSMRTRTVRSSSDVLRVKSNEGEKKYVSKEHVGNTYGNYRDEHLTNMRMCHITQMGDISSFEMIIAYFLGIPHWADDQTRSQPHTTPSHKSSVDNWTTSPRNPEKQTKAEKSKAPLTRNFFSPLQCFSLFGIMLPHLRPTSTINGGL
ncbi:unnamed protein product [Dicrocoelium dendriticum]|nr:unnamed protein product [Dicrocoelium dendriticum]